MGRNLFRRIEVAFPVVDPVLRKRVVDEGLDIYLADKADAWLLAPDGTWSRARGSGRERKLSAQAELLERMRARTPAT
jgi:polyphosphate kinase